MLDFVYVNNPKVFDKQAGDMQILSGYLIRSIYGTPNMFWRQNDVANNSHLLLSGFNSYLLPKNISVSPEDLQQSTEKQKKPNDY